MDLSEDHIRHAKTDDMEASLSLKPDFSVDESDAEEASEWDGLEDETLSASLAEMAMKNELSHEDWLPAKLRSHVNK